jgi:hypothetical protein
MLAYRSVVAKLAWPASTRTVVSGTSARIHNTIAVGQQPRPAKPSSIR